MMTVFREYSALTCFPGEVQFISNKLILWLTHSNDRWKTTARTTVTLFQQIYAFLRNVLVNYSYRLFSHGPFIARTDKMY